MKKKRRISLLLPLGLLLLAGALAGLLSVPSVTQYVFLPGNRKPAELVQGLQSMEKELGDAYTGLTLYASQAGAVLSVNGGTSEDSVTLYRTAPRYFELCPRAFRSGRPLSRGDSADQAREERRYLINNEG